MIKHSGHPMEKEENEFKKESSTSFMYEIQRNDMMPAFREHYQRTEETLDAWRLPHKSRWNYRKLEYYYVFLMMHDFLPNDYMNQLLPKDTPPKGAIFNFFSKKDDINTARKKWYAAIKFEYDLFWEVFLSAKELEDYELQTQLMIYDVLSIIKFISPGSIAMIYNHPEFLHRLNSFVKFGKKGRHMVTTRHKFYYEWLYFGWRPLSYHYPVYKHSNDYCHKNISN